MERKSSSKSQALSQKRTAAPTSSYQTSQQAPTQKQTCVGQVGDIE